jgi:RHS repeat-associated protein
MFTGKELDTETGLYYYGARYYDPRLTLWENPDPILGKYLDGKPNGGIYNPFNLGNYGYVSQNPLRLVDPDGKVAIEDDLVVGAIGAVIGIGGQVVEDISHGKRSTWQAYLGSAVGGAVGLDLTYNATVLSGGTLTGPALIAAKEAAGAAGGFVSDSLSSVTEDLTSNDHKVDWSKAGKKGAVGAGFGLIPGGDFTASEAKTLITKLGEKGIKKVSLKSAGKIGLGKGLESVIPSSAESVGKGLYERHEDKKQNQEKK